MTFPLTPRATVVVGLVAAGLGLSACSTVEDLLSGDKIDYRTASKKTSGLEVPPDLTQLSRDSRYQAPSGSVSASTFQAARAAGPAPSLTPVVAPQSAGAFRIERLGNERWLSTTLSPEELYPQLRAFWRDNGFVLVQDRADAGVLETDWAENRAKLPRDIIRATLGRVIDSIYSTSELDKFRTRVERTATGSDVYITHRGMVEVYRGERAESTVWQPRAVDRQLEAEFLSRLMIRLGVKDDQAKAMVASSAAPAAPARARVLDGRPGPTLEVDDNFDRAWRRVGVALDRSGFTVEDRDRAQGVYFVRYVDPAFAGREEPGFLARMLSLGRRKAADEGSPVRYRVKVDGSLNTSIVAVLDSQGRPETGEAGRRISALLLEDLK